MRLAIDSARCTGHGRCYSLAPGLFAPREDDGNGKVLFDDVPPELRAEAHRAANSCPELAIQIREEATDD